MKYLCKIVMLLIIELKLLVCPDIVRKEVVETNFLRAHDNLITPRIEKLINKER